MSEVQISYQSQSQKLLCEICYDNYKQDNESTDRPGNICYSCWYNHLKTAVSHISYKVGSQIISPFQGQQPIDICVALNTLKKIDSEEIQQSLFKKYTSFKADIQKCPSHSCDYVFTIQTCKWGMNQNHNCPKCDAPLLHSNSLDIKSMMGSLYFLLIANKCPSCQIPIQKTTGCPHMTCPCGHQFCWYCLKDYFPMANNIYSIHEPKQCGAILLSKVIFLSFCLSGIFFTVLGNQIFRQYMGYFFIGLSYIIQTIIVDIAIVINAIIINNLLMRNHHNYYHRNSATKYYIGSLVLVDVIIITLLYFFLYDILVSSFFIILFELALAGFGYVLVLLISTSLQNWFDYIM